MDDRALDELLQFSVPPLTEPPRVRSAVSALVAETARRSRRPKVDARLAIGVAIGLVIGGTSVASANPVPGWDPYDAAPTFTVTVTLPSGIVCVYDYDQVATGDLSNPDRPADDSNLDADLAEWLRTTDVLALADLDSARREYLYGEAQIFGVQLQDDGSAVDSPLLLSSFNADQQHQMVVQRAIDVVIFDEAQRRGFSGLAYGMTPTCGEDRG